MNEPDEITSRDNERVKRIRKIRDGKIPDRIFVEGVRLVDEALSSPIQVESIFATRDQAREYADAGVEMFRVADSVFQSMTDTAHPQGVIAVAVRPESGLTGVEERLSTADLPLVVLLHEINNPLNLGAVVRTAEAAGAAGVITTKASADPFSSKAVRAAMGSSFRLPIASGIDFDEAVRWAKQTGCRLVAADLRGELAYTEVDWSDRRMLVMGSEGHGLGESEISQIDDVILIPMASEVESLNLAVACGVVLFEARRQMMSR